MDEAERTAEVAETHESAETKRIEEGLVLKDGARHELRRRYDRLASLRRAEIDSLARSYVVNAARAAVSASVAAPDALAVTTSYTLRLLYSTDHRLAQLQFDRRRETSSMDSRDVDELLQLMGVLGVHSQPTFCTVATATSPASPQQTPSRDMPCAGPWTESAADGRTRPWIVVLGGATAGSSASAMKTVRAIQAACRSRNLPVIFVVGTEYRTSQICPRADACDSRRLESRRRPTIVHPRRECDGSTCHRLSQCLECGSVGDRDISAASNILYAKLSEWLHGQSEFDRPSVRCGRFAALTPQSSSTSSA